MASEFKKAVERIVGTVPAGTVVSYGQVAAYVGVPQAARQVGQALKNMEEVELPWWRVINNAGRISIKGNWNHDAQMQKELLENEGVVVGDDFSVKIEKYRYRPDVSQMRKMGLPEGYAEVVWRKFGRGFISM